MCMPTVQSCAMPPLLCKIFAGTIAGHIVNDLFTIREQGLVDCVAIGHRRSQISARSSEVNFMSPNIPLDSISTSRYCPTTLFTRPRTYSTPSRAIQLHTWTKSLRKPSTTLPSADWLAPQAAANAKLAATPSARVEDCAPPNGVYLLSRAVGLVVWLHMSTPSSVSHNTFPTIDLHLHLHPPHVWIRTITTSS